MVQTSKVTSQGLPSTKWAPLMIFFTKTTHVTQQWKTTRLGILVVALSMSPMLERATMSTVGTCSWRNPVKNHQDNPGLAQASLRDIWLRRSRLQHAYPPWWQKKQPSLYVKSGLGKTFKSTTVVACLNHKKCKSDFKIGNFKTRPLRRKEKSSNERRPKPDSTQSASRKRCGPLAYPTSQLSRPTTSCKAAFQHPTLRTEGRRIRAGRTCLPWSVIRWQHKSRALCLILISESYYSTTTLLYSWNTARQRCAQISSQIVKKVTMWFDRLKQSLTLPISPKSR